MKWIRLFIFLAVGLFLALAIFLTFSHSDVKDTSDNIIDIANLDNNDVNVIVLINWTKSITSIGVPHTDSYYRTQLRNNVPGYLDTLFAKQFKNRNPNIVYAYFGLVKSDNGPNPDFKSNYINKILSNRKGWNRNDWSYVLDQINEKSKGYHTALSVAPTIGLILLSPEFTTKAPTYVILVSDDYYNSSISSQELDDIQDYSDDLNLNPNHRVDNISWANDEWGRFNAQYLLKEVDIRHIDLPAYSSADKKHFIISTFELAPTQAQAFENFIGMQKVITAERLCSDSLSIAANVEIKTEICRQRMFTPSHAVFSLYKNDSLIQQDNILLSDSLHTIEYRNTLQLSELSRYSLALNMHFGYGNSDALSKYDYILGDTMAIEEKQYKFAFIIPIQGKLLDYNHHMNYISTNGLKWVLNVTSGVFSLFILFTFLQMAIMKEPEPLLTLVTQKQKIEYTIGQNSKGGGDSLLILSISPDTSKLSSLQAWFLDLWDQPKKKLSPVCLKADFPDIIKKTSEDFLVFMEKEQPSQVNKGGIELGASQLTLPLAVRPSIIEDIKATPRRINEPHFLSVICTAVSDETENTNYSSDPTNIEIDIYPFPAKGPSFGNIEPLAPDGVEYYSNRKQDVFQLNLKNESIYRYTNPAVGKLRLNAIHKNLKKDVSDYFILKTDGKEDRRQSDVTVLANNELPVTIAIDSGRMPGNPSVPETYEVFFTLLTDNGAKILQESKKFDLTVKPNPIQNELGIRWSVLKGQFDNWHYDDDKDEDGIFRKDEEIEYILECNIEKNNRFRILSLELNNKATEIFPPGQINIDNLEYKLEMSTSKDRAISGELMITMPQTINRCFILASGQKYNIDFILPMKFLTPCFLENDHSKCTLSVSFDFETMHNSRLEKKGTIQFNVIFEIRRAVDRCLALDFGTSAIAVCFRDESKDENDATAIKIPNLSQIHREKTGGLHFPDENTNFLSSMIYLNYEEHDVRRDKKSGRLVAHLPEEILGFAPSKDRRETSHFHNTLLPSMKTLIGYNEIPFLPKELWFEALQPAGDQKVYKDIDINVPTVLREAYLILFKKYIIQAIHDEFYKEPGAGAMGAEKLLSSLGKIVITIPNTFNQLHRRIIRQLLEKDITWGAIAKGCLENLRKKTGTQTTNSETNDKSAGMESASDTLNEPGHERLIQLGKKDGSVFYKVNFISESDCVIIYYIKKKDLKKSENVLAYDIGAGTLDITLARIDYDTKEEIISVKELCKLGINRAGNTLDTILAKILCIRAAKIWKEDKIDRLDRAFPAAGDASGGNFQKAVRFKDFIRDDFKKMLSKHWNNESGQFGYDDLLVNEEFKNALNNSSFMPSGVEIKAGDSEQQQKSIRLLREIFDLETFWKSDILDNFLNSITGEAIEILANMSNAKEKEKLKVDRVIVTGRTSQFAPLREKLIKALNEKTTLSVDKNTEITGNPVWFIEGDELKNAVVTGAVFAEKTNIRFERKRINAYYGLLWKARDFGDFKYQFSPVLEPGDQPCGNHPPCELFREKLNLRNAGKVMLIQSYIPKPENDYSISKTDKISKIAEVQTSSSDQRRLNEVEVTVDMDENYMLEMSVQGQSSEAISIYTTLDKHLEYQENTWPYNDMQHLREEMKGLLPPSKK